MKTIAGVVAIKEQRLYTRVSSQITLQLYYNNKLVATCNVVNIGVGGVLVESGEIGLSVNSLIQIQFVVNEGHSLYQLRLPAIVKRIENNKIAIAFEMLEKATEEIIKQEIITRSQ